MKFFKTVVAESSLLNTDILKKIRVIRTFVDNSITFYEIALREKEIKLLQYALQEKSSGVFLFSNIDEDMYIVFKNKYFKAKKSDIVSWEKAKAYATSLGFRDNNFYKKVDLNK